jgi:hypothetical protein
MNQVQADGSVVTLVHFLYAHAGGGSTGTDWRIACMPGVTEFHQTPHHPNYQMTNDTRATTCPSCKRTAPFKRAQEALDAALGARRG